MPEEIKDKILDILKATPEGLPDRKLMGKAGVRDTNLFRQALSQLKAQGKVSVSRSHRVRAAGGIAVKKSLPPVPQSTPIGAKKPAPLKPQSTAFAQKPVSQKPSPTMKKIKAVIVSLSRGFAFARPEDGGDDLFVPGSALNSAFLGDTVMLGNLQTGGKGPSADVEEIMEKRDREMTGTVVCKDSTYEMIPDAAIRYNIPIERGTGMTARDGEKVLARIRRVVDRGRDTYTASILRIYGSADCARICADAIIDQNGIRTVFPEEVIAEAKKISKQKITEKELRDRLDLRDTNICTIDSESAKDLDDAISVSRTRLGYRLGVHIADVSHYVREGGAMDMEARERGTSVYFADRVIPMLPEELSNGVCSLNAGEDKLTFSAIIELDKRGAILSYQFRKSVINSKVRGVYAEVNQLFDGTADKELRQKYAHVIRSLNTARELAQVLRERSKRHGTVDLESSESYFVLNENGLCVDVLPRQTGESEQMIEQLMITANKAAAKLAKSANLPFVYRVHEKPAPDRVQTLAELVGALGLNAKSLTHPGDTTTGDFAAVMDQARGTQKEKVISHQLLRTMAKARYDTAPVGHFGLALADYCHFTSPIRRYPDTSIHRILGSYLKKEKGLQEHYAAFVQFAASNSSKCEVSAMMAERSAEDCYMAEYMKQHLGETYDGIISGVTMRGVFVELPNSVEGFVPVDSFEGARFEFDGMMTQTDAVTGRKLTIGQALRVTAVSADVASGKIDFMPAAVN